MISSFSGQSVPPDKLFVLYYPPALAHQNWSKSVYAAARAREAVSQAIEELRRFEDRYVRGPRLWLPLTLGGVGVALVGYWLWAILTRWPGAGFLSTFVAPIAGLALAAYGRSRWQAYRERRRLWSSAGFELAVKELEELEKQSATLPEDPTAEEAAPIMRRECPEILSEIAFQGQNFRAFTYLDFVMFRRLKHPLEQEELPKRHSLNRDAYYVGDVVYDSWRTFHRDRREIVDPRFAGSGGRRGVI